MRRLGFAIVFVACLAGLAMADDPAPAAKMPVPGKLEDLAFMTGCWKAAHWGGEMEECWSSPSGDAMAAMFRFIKDGKVQFYEFIAIEQTPEGLYLRLKHFNRGLIGWEEKDKSVGGPLTALEKNKATFDWLTFERRSPDVLVVSLRMKKGDQVTNEVMEFQRVK
ncbi:MAG: DUF6265 family protein [Terriglobales bacterium]